MIEGFALLREIYVVSDNCSGSEKLSLKVRRTQKKNLYYFGSSLAHNI